MTTDTRAPQESVPASPPAPAAAPRGSGVLWPVVQILLVAAALGAAGWVWYEGRMRAGAAEEELARRLRGIEEEARDARAAARASQDGVRELQAKLALVEGRLAETQSRQASLESLYQEVSGNRDEWQIAEIEQVLAIAQQQLQLAGNVRAALIALELADARLARVDRPQFMAVRRALGRDIERLKNRPADDLGEMSRALGLVIGAVDGLPLAAERPRTREEPEPRSPVPGGALERFGAGLWRDLKELVVVRRVDAPDPPLLPATQAYFLRENLRLRLLSARLALLSRNRDGFTADLRSAQQWLQRYYEPDSRATQEALARLKALLEAPLGVEPPSIADSLEAVRSFRPRRERAPG